LKHGQGDIPVMSKDCDTEIAFRKRMARLTEQNGCRAEIVTNSPALQQLGEVVCMLRDAMDASSSDSQNTNT
jgi:hypothetical protein